MTRGTPGRRGGAGKPSPTEVVPLSYRVSGTMAFRAVTTAVLTALSVHAGVGGTVTDLAVSAAYLTVTGLFALTVLTRRRDLTVLTLGMALLTDTAYLQYEHHRMGHGLGVDLAVGGFLVAVCLLASFRTALKIAVWQSLLLVVVDEAAKSGLISDGAGPHADGGLLAHVVLTWLVVITASSSAAVNERELRRRRIDAEALREFAERLHECDDPGQVAERLVRFVAEEVDARRALVCRRDDARLDLVAGHALAEGPPSDARPSALIDRTTAEEPLLALRLDPELDPWLDTLLPGARRIVAVRLGTGPHYLVFPHGAPGGSRVERRVISTVAQACATAALAMSRAQLLVRARVAASTDGLTGVFNRRTFDEELDRFTLAQHRGGQPLGLVMVDVDHFKSINDTHGHQVGDLVLQQVAATLRETAGTRALVFRYGGEEFAVLLPGFATAPTAAVAEELRVALEGIGDPVPVTASFGAASLPTDASGGSELVAVADAALLVAKQTGRNRVVCAAPAGVRP